MNQQDWPAGLDALSAAPQHHALLFENEAVRVLDTSVPPELRARDSVRRASDFVQIAISLITLSTSPYHEHGDHNPKRVG
jgi:hypothetical protein